MLAPKKVFKRIVMTTLNPFCHHILQLKPPKMNMQLSKLILGKNWKLKLIISLMLLNCNQKILEQLQIQPQELVPIVFKDSAMSTQEGRAFQKFGKSINPIEVLNLKPQTELKQKLRTL
ncbi:hypothetical protein V8G54_032969 [Vigna mungo]|uniref:Uncharacterized protein n=1 Tax=Vigna mungo TaxID=3915 RepID=A0AAQ3RH67_VIGMU